LSKPDARGDKIPQPAEPVGTASPADGSTRLQGILEDLEQLFFAEGFLHLSTEELAARLRCSKRTIYQLAPSRKALFELVIDRFLSEIREAGEVATRAAPDWPTAVTAYLNVAVERTRAAGPNFVRDLARFPSGYRRLMRHQRVRMAGLERIVAAGVAAGAFRHVHPKLVAEVMLLAVARVVDPAFLASVDLSMSQAFEELYQIFNYGLMGRGDVPGADSLVSDGEHLGLTNTAEKQEEENNGVPVSNDSVSRRLQR
jgi:AcrR family transcriptional regulator